MAKRASSQSIEARTGVDVQCPRLMRPARDRVSRPWTSNPYRLGRFGRFSDFGTGESARALDAGCADPVSVGHDLHRSSGVVPAVNDRVDVRASESVLEASRGAGFHHVTEGGPARPLRGVPVTQGPMGSLSRRQAPPQRRWRPPRYEGGAIVVIDAVGAVGVAPL